MRAYPFRDIEPKWQAYWEENATFRATEDLSVPPEKRAYILDMFPYPSAAGLHVGHPEGYTATDIYSRFLRANGYNVLHPMGFDSFGLPAETYAIQTGTPPKVTTEANIKRFTEQLKALGFSYDWDRVINTHDADYYRWTQWIFLKLYERGLAYMAEIPVWYCEALGTVLANEEVLATENGPRSERGNHPVVRRPVRQWMLRITAYADRLLEGLDELDWPESIKISQRNWIGRSEGANVHFALAPPHGEPLAKPLDGASEGAESTDDSIEVFTTRPDTLFGATYMVLAPEHPLVAKITTEGQRAEVAAYVEQARTKSDLERTDLAKEKTGAFTGAYAINPVNDERIPVWISDYILLSYGTGAIMAVPAHDERDFAFAQKYNLPIVTVVVPEEANPETAAGRGGAFADPGIAVNSGKFNGRRTAVVKQEITTWLEELGVGTRAVNYKLRDWIFARQRYWGEPIPLVHCPDGEIQPVPEDQLPLTLPQVDSYQPTGTGESPLAAVTEWIETPCPADPSKMGRRETNTMPQWAGSCWYFLRFIDPKNTAALAAPDKVAYWMPVDLYVGGQEHAVLHLLYARFWHKVLYDLGVVNTSEPFQRLVNQGMILGEDGSKMSKSLGNVINPDDVIRDFGADSMRMYLMFMGPLRQQKPWSTNGLMGVHRFLDRVWRLSERVEECDATEEQTRLLHKTIKKVTLDTKGLDFNTAIAQMMIFTNDLYKAEAVPRSLWDPFVRLLGPYAPHLAEELWGQLGHAPSISTAPWPEYDEELTKEEVVTIVLQVNGKVRGRIDVERDTPEDELREAALNDDNVKRFLKGKEPKRIIVVENKLVNLVTGK